MFCVLALSAPAASIADSDAAPGVEKRFTLARVGSAPLLTADLAVEGTRVWIASQGGGLLAVESGRIVRHFDLGHGLPSAVVHQVKIASPQRVLAATERGLVVIDPATGSTQGVTSEAIEKEGFGDGAADVLTVSEVDGSAVFQLSLRDRGPEQGAAASLWVLDRGVVERWTPIDEGTPEATTGYYDASSGCVYIAGMVAARSSLPSPWLARRCGKQTTAWRFGDSAPLHAMGVAAMARDPATKRLVMVFVVQPTGDQATRRYVVMEVIADGRLAPHCSGTRTTSAVMGLVAGARTLLIAMRGEGVRPLTCQASRPIGGENAGPTDVTAFAVARNGDVWIGTATALFAVTSATGAVQATLSPRETQIPIDVVATDQQLAGGRVLLSSPNAGILELQRNPAGWEVSRRWPAAELPRGIYGPAKFGTGGEIFAIVRSRGVARYEHGRWALLEPDSAFPVGHPLQLAAVPGGLWIALGGSAFDMRGAGLVLLREGKTIHVPLAERQVQPTGALLPWPDGKVWAGTRLGIVEVEPSGKVRRLSRNRVDSMHRDERSGAVVAVGATIERWNGSEFNSLFFDPSRESRITGHPIDAVIDGRGRITILYSSGHLALLDSQLQLVTVLGSDDGVPASSRALLRIPKTEEILISSAREGLFSFKWP